MLKERAVELAAATASAAAAASKSDTAAAAAQQEKAAAAERVQQLTTENAALTTANTELEETATANAENTALLGKNLHTVLSELDETLPDEVSTCNCYVMLYWCMHVVL